MKRNLELSGETTDEDTLSESPEDDLISPVNRGTPTRRRSSRAQSLQLVPVRAIIHDVEGQRYQEYTRRIRRHSTASNVVSLRDPDMPPPQQRWVRPNGTARRVWEPVRTIGYLIYIFIVLRLLLRSLNANKEAPKPPGSRNL